MRCFTYLIVSCLLVFGQVSCQATANGEKSPTSTETKAETKDEASSEHEGPRIVAFGDTHGDLDATLRVLELAGAIDKERDKLRWTGGDMILVQTGDYLDRGDEERQILDLYRLLELQAEEAGGRFVILNGNHEIMNSMGDLRYVTQKGFSDFSDFAPPTEQISPFEGVPMEAYGRLYAFLPGKPYAMQLGSRDIVTLIDGTVFVHGSITEAHLKIGIEDLNAQTRAWLRGELTAPPEFLVSPEGPLWSSLYSDEQTETSCDELAQVLDGLGAKRMVVGHMVQDRGVTSDCDGKIWRVDVGLSKFYGGDLQALELTGGTPVVLK